MDTITAIQGSVSDYLSGVYPMGTTQTDSSNADSFATIFQSAVDMVKNTNDLQHDAEIEEINFALGYSDNSHTLQIAQEKASIALQYTLAVRDRFLEAYDKIMNMQI